MSPKQVREALLASIPSMGEKELHETEVRVCSAELPNKKPYFQAIEARKEVLSKEVDVMAVSSEVKMDY